MDKGKLVNLAHQLGIKQHTSDIRSLIHTIQKAQGTVACYKSDMRYTCKSECDWNSSCKKLTAAWLR